MPSSPPSCNQAREGHLHHGPHERRPVCPAVQSLKRRPRPELESVDVIAGQSRLSNAYHGEWSRRGSVRSRAISSPVPRAGASSGRCHPHQTGAKRALAVDQELGRGDDLFAGGKPLDDLGPPAIAEIVAQTCRDQPGFEGAFTLPLMIDPFRGSGSNDGFGWHGYRCARRVPAESSVTLPNMLGRKCPSELSKRSRTGRVRVCGSSSG